MGRLEREVFFPKQKEIKCDSYSTHTLEVLSHSLHSKSQLDLPVASGILDFHFTTVKFPK